MGAPSERDHISTPVLDQGAGRAVVPESPSGVLVIALVAAVVVLLAGRTSRALRRLSLRLGLDGGRAFGQWERAAQWLIALTVVGIVLRRMSAPLPGWASPLIAIVGFVLWLLTTGALSDVFGGLAAQYRTGLRVGDHVDIGGLTGQVREIHLSYVQLRSAGGTDVSVPGRRFLSESVKVAPVRGSQPLTVRVNLRRPLRATETETLRERLLFMPYRVPGSQLRLDPAGVVLTVSCALWQQGALGPAEDFVRAVCTEVVEDDEEDSA